MKSMEELKEILDGEIKKIAKKGDITPQELDNMYKAIDIIKDIQTIDAMKKADEQGGYSQGRSYDGQSNNYSNNSYGNSMEGNMSRNQSMDGQSNRYYMPYYYPMTYAGGPVWNQPEQQMMQSERGSYNSYRGSYDDGMSNARAGRDGDGDGRYSEDSSYRRGRDARTGRYVSRDGSYDRYSRHTEKERMIEKLETMMDSAGSEKERRAIQQCIDKLED